MTRTLLRSALSRSALAVALAAGLAACGQAKDKPQEAGAQAGGEAAAGHGEVAGHGEAGAPTQAHGAPTQAHGAGMPPGHPPMAGGAPMMGAKPPAEPQNPREVTPSGEVRSEVLGELTLEVPTEWEKRPPANSMRVGEFILPGPGGDTTLAVFRFPGGGGGVESNINRWKGQFVPPAGKSIDDVTTIVTEERGPLKITRVDILGTNNAEVVPGEGDRVNEPDSRMLAVIVEGAGDPFFLKAAGRSATLNVWAPAFETTVKSIAIAGADK